MTISKSLLTSVLLFLLCFILSDRAWTSKNRGDYYRFWMVGDIHKKLDIDNIYSPKWLENLRTIKKEYRLNTETYRLKDVILKNRISATPLFYMVIDLMASGHLAADYEFYRLLSIFSFSLGLVFLLHLLKYDVLRSLTAIGFIIFVFYPIKMDILWANAGLIQFGLTALIMVLLYYECHLWTGVTLAFYTLFKPSVVFVPVLLFLFWAQESKKTGLAKKFLGFFIGLLLCVVAPHLYWGPYCTWGDWHSAALANVKFASLVDKYFYWENNHYVFHHSYLFYSTFALCPIAIFYISKRIVWDTPSFLPLISMGLALFLLTGPIIQVHYFLLALPLILWSLRPQHKYSMRILLPSIIGTVLVSFNSAAIRLLAPFYLVQFGTQATIGVAILIISCYFQIRHKL